MITSKELKKFITEYYPHLYVERYGIDPLSESSAFFNLLDKSTGEALINNVDFRELKEYLEKEFGFHEVFVKKHKNEVLHNYLNLVLNMEAVKTEDGFYLYDFFPLETMKTPEFKESLNNTPLSQEKLNKYIINFPHFSLKNLLPYICPVCNNLEKYRFSKNNAIIYQCKYCGYEIVEIL